MVRRCSDGILYARLAEDIGILRKDFQGFSQNFIWFLPRPGDRQNRPNQRLHSFFQVPRSPLKLALWPPCFKGGSMISARRPKLLVCVLCYDRNYCFFLFIAAARAIEAVP